LELLLTQTSNFLVFLKNVRSFETIQALNQDLEQRNRELQQTIDELTASRRKIEMLERAGAHIKAVLQRETERLQRVTALDLVLILAAGLLLGLLFNLSNPHGTAVIPSAWKRPAAVRIAPAPVRRMLETGQAVLVDARPAEFYRQRHIQGALNVPPSLFDFIYAMRFADLDLEKPVVVYGRNISSHYDEEVAFKLSSRGHQRIRILEGGLEAWEELGLPVQAQ
jgi:rhodanese-related sulfurtransferase